MKNVMLVILMMVLVVSNAFASKARARTMVDRLIEEKRSGRVTDVRSIEAEQHRFETSLERLLRRKSGLSSSELNMNSLREYVSKFERDAHNLDSLSELINNITARGNVIPAQQESSANLLAQAMRLNERGGFMVEPRDILEIDRHWTVAEKDQFADVMTEARQIATDRPELTSNQALESALKNRGLWEKFKRRCA
jgi:hypothetical protein